ncbi:MAG: EAL domain-containing protein [Cocleimonas sp.]|nr:EAL domain-containing protein [Cocleimonas sp.]
MGYNDLQCLLIGERSNSYKNLAKILATHESNIYAKYIDADKVSIKRALKKQRTATLIFISDEVPFSLESLSDLVWQYSSDAIIVILTEKTATTSLKKPFNNTQISKLHLDIKAQNDSRLYLEYLIQAIQLKKEFRRCKHFLSVAEQRCQWLVDSSHEAVAFIGRDLHLYANTAYLGLFDIDSIHELPSIPVRELMVENERSLFDGFVKKQIRKHEIKHSLVISLKKRNGKTFRANVHIIPSVYRGSPCLQLWVHPLNAFMHKQELNQKNNEEKSKKSSLQDQLLIKDENAIEVLNKNVVTETSILHSIIKRKEATITAQKLGGMKATKGKNTDEHHLLSLKVPAPQIMGIENLLFTEGGIGLKEKRQIFWDKVKITRLLQTLIKKKNLKTNLLVCLNEATTTDKNFFKWFKPGLGKIGIKTSKLIFLLPAQVDKKELQSLLKLTRELRLFNSKIGLDGFSATSEALTLLKHLRPNYVRLSLPWVKKIEGNESREVALASFIRQLESRNIQVIAPCDLSKDMRRLFTLSGVSFCQERTLKSG